MIIYLSFLIILLILLIISWMLSSRKNIYIKTINRMKICHKNIMKMFTEIQPYLQKNGLEYFIMSGTLLGYVRHNKNFIPHDDDIDLGILNSSEITSRIKNLEKDILPLGYKIVDKFFGWAIYYQDPKIMGYIDLFLIEEKGGRFTVNDRALFFWPREYFLPDELFPLKQDYFGDLLVNIPNQPIPYLQRLFGKNVLNECVFTHIHNGESLDKFIMMITNHISPYKVDCN
jgi:phosphorylcholine metabolism protein LicD